MDEARAKEVCKGCGRCCEWILAYFPEGGVLQVEFLLTRGCRRAVEQDREGLAAWFIPSTCQHLDPETKWCTIHDDRSSEGKPYLCRVWTPYSDPSAGLEPIMCKWLQEV